MRRAPNICTSLTRYASRPKHMRLPHEICVAPQTYAPPSRDMRRAPNICASLTRYASRPKHMRLPHEICVAHQTYAPPSRYMRPDPNISGPPASPCAASSKQQPIVNPYVQKYESQAQARPHSHRNSPSDIFPAASPC